MFIASQLHISKSVVSQTVNAWKRGEIVTVKRQRKPKKTKLTAQQMYKILMYFVKNPFHTYKECIKSLNLSVSLNTVKKVLKGDGIYNRVACPKPFISLLNQIKRLKFALKYCNLTAADWLQVCFLHEKTIQTYRNSTAMVKRRINERFDSNKVSVKEIQNSENKVNLVGVISHNGPNKIYSVSTNLTGNEFDQLIKLKIKNDVTGTVLMNNASIHKKDFKRLLESGVRVFDDFPPKSPDVNIIENVWSLLQRILNRKLLNAVVPNQTDVA